MKFKYIVIDTNDGDAIVNSFKSDYQISKGDVVKIIGMEEAIGKEVKIVCVSKDNSIELYV